MSWLYKTVLAINAAFEMLPLKPISVVVVLKYQGDDMIIVV